MWIDGDPISSQGLTTLLKEGRDYLPMGDSAIYHKVAVLRTPNKRKKYNNEMDMNSSKETADSFFPNLFICLLNLFIFIAFLSNIHAWHVHFGTLIRNAS